MGGGAETQADAAGRAAWPTGQRQFPPAATVAADVRHRGGRVTGVARRRELELDLVLGSGAGAAPRATCARSARSCSRRDGNACLARFFACLVRSWYSVLP